MARNLRGVGRTPSYQRPADWVVTDTTSFLAAFAGATAGQVIEFRADIPAPASNTLISFAPGITVRTDGTPRAIGSAAQTKGYCFGCANAGGVQTKTTWLSGLTIYAKDANTGGSTGLIGTFAFANGVLDFRARITGKNGGTGRAGNNLTVYDSASYPCIVELYGNVADSASSDCVSIIGYNASNDVVTDHNVGSRLTGRDLVIYSPGTGTSDNWITGHQGFPIYVYGGTFSQIGGGPGVNSGPATGTMELYGVSMDVSGWTNATSAPTLAATKVVGCTITGAPVTSTIAAALVIYGDANNASQRSCAIGNTSTIPIHIGTGHTVDPVLYRNTIDANATIRAVSDSVVGFGEISGANRGALCARNTVSIFNATVRNKGFANTQTSTVCSNNSVIITTSTASGRVVIQPAGGTGNTTVYHSFACTGGQSVYGIRVDAATNAVATDCAFQATTAAQFGGSAANAVNCTIDGSTPSGASIGVAGLGPQLQSGTGASMVAALESYLTANASGVGAGTGFVPYTSIASAMASF